MPFPYDLSVVTLFSFKAAKHQKMGALFSRKGLQNIKNRRVILHALLHKDDLKTFSKLSFPCEVKIHLYDTNSPGVKQYTFYAENLPSIAGEAPWHLQADDDSFTDVDGLLDSLDTYYDSSDRLYLTAYLMYDLYDEMAKIAQGLGYGHCGVGLKVPSDSFAKFTKFTHEWEAAVRSHSCMRSIAALPDALELLRQSARKQIWWGDHGMAFASMMCRVQPGHCLFLSHTNHWDDFTLNGGHLAHIHYINESMEPKVEELKAIEEAFRARFVGVPLSYGSQLGLPGMSVYTNQLVLGAAGKIEGYGNGNERVWDVSGNVLRIRGQNNHVTSKYKLVRDQISGGMVTGVFCSDLSYINVFLARADAAPIQHV